MIRRHARNYKRATGIALAMALVFAGRAASKDGAAIAASGDRLWVGLNGLLTEIDLQTHRIESTTKIGWFAVEVVAEQDRVWVLSTDGGVGPSRISLVRPRARIGSRSRRVPGVGAGLAQWRGSIWAVVNHRGDRGALVEFAPNLERVRRSLPLPGSARGVAAWNGSLWIALDHRLGRYDGRRLRLTGAGSSGEESPFHLQPTSDVLWIGNYDTAGGSVSRVGDAGPIPVTSFPRARPLIAIAANPTGGVWALSLHVQTGVGSVRLVGTTATNPAHDARFAGWPSALTQNRHYLWVVRPRARAVTAVDIRDGTRRTTIRLPRE